MKIKINSFLVALALILSSCNPVDKTGYRFEYSDAHLLKKGITSKENVQKIMGSPTLISYLDEETWIYYLQDEKKFMFFRPEILDRKITTISFDEYQIIDKINHYNLADQNQIQLAQLKTNDVQINEKKSFFSRIFSNIGQITPN